MEFKKIIVLSLDGMQNIWKMKVVNTNALKHHLTESIKYHLKYLFDLISYTSTHRYLLFEHTIYITFTLNIFTLI